MEEEYLYVKGLYASLNAINKVTAGLAPWPYAWGKCNTPHWRGGSRWFLLTDFRDVADDPPSLSALAEPLANMHKQSKSHTAKFGFSVTTHVDGVPQLTNCWNASWAVLFGMQLEHACRLDQEKNGHSSELAGLCETTLEQVVPRLLVPLQSNGRSIKPCLVHGNVRARTVALDRRSGLPFVHSPASFFAHHEYELGCLQGLEHECDTEDFLRSYWTYYPASEPGTYHSPIGHMVLLANNPTRRGTGRS
jgi:protein-ribulosamine 3-kinase